MEWAKYQKRFKLACYYNEMPSDQVQELLGYAKNLYNKGLPIIYDVKHLSKLIGYNCAFLYKVSNGTKSFYRTFFIPKSNGSLRKIEEPFPTLKEIQNWILVNILQKASVNRFAKAYRKKVTIIDNVKFHKAQPIIMKYDLENFFGTISTKSVVGIFLEMGYTKSLSMMLAKLCCLNNCLPQGAPTSPYLSNLYCRELDNRIGGYVVKCGFRYTRYSDDITISGNISEMQIISLRRFIGKTIKEYNLKINERKTRVLRKSNRQTVTGVVLNSKISAGSITKKEIRQTVYYIQKYGLESHLRRVNNTQPNYLQHVIGKINWVLYLEKNNEEFKKYKEILTGILLQ